MSLQIAAYACWCLMWVRQRSCLYLLAPKWPKAACRCLCLCVTCSRNCAALDTFAVGVCCRASTSGRSWAIHIAVLASLNLLPLACCHLPLLQAMVSYFCLQGRPDCKCVAACSLWTTAVHSAFLPGSSPTTRLRWSSVGRGGPDTQSALVCCCRLRFCCRLLPVAVVDAVACWRGSGSGCCASGSKVSTLTLTPSVDTSQWKRLEDLADCLAKGKQLVNWPHQCSLLSTKCLQPSLVSEGTLTPASLSSLPTARLIRTQVCNSKAVCLTCQLQLSVSSAHDICSTCQK